MNPASTSDRSVPWPARLRAIPSHYWVAIAAASYLFIFVRVQWRVGDEGDILNGALAVSEGRVPYRDFFDLRGPGSFYWLGLFFKVFGATWQVARVHLLLTGTLTSLLVYHLTKRVCGTREAVLTCALVTTLSLPLWPASHHHWDSNLFALAAVAAFFRWQHEHRSRWVLTSGLLAGLASCFIYQKGFLLVVSFLATMTITRFHFRERIGLVRCACTLLTGYGAVGVTVLAWFTYLGALPDFIDGTIRFPVTTYADANKLPYAHMLLAQAFGGLAPWRVFPSGLALPVAVLSMLPLLLVAALPFLVLALGGWCLVTQPAVKWLRVPIVAYGLSGFALWFSEFHRPDLMHLIYGCPLLLITLWLLWNAVDKGRLLKTLVPAAVGISVLLLAVGQGLRAATADVHIRTRRGPIVMPHDDLALRFLLSDEVNRGDYVFVYPYYSTYYFLADVRNPTRFGEMMYGPGSKPYFDEAIAAIDARQVKFILWDTLVDGENLKEWFPAYQPPPANERWMELYFQAHYEQLGVLSGFRVLRRRESSPVHATPVLQ